MTEWDWKAIAAVWGAALSTLLFVARLLPARPRFVVRPPKLDVHMGDDRGDALIEITNLGRTPLLIRDLVRIPLLNCGRELALYTPKSSLLNISRRGSLLIVCPENSRIAVKALWDSPANWLVVFLWQAPGLLPIWMPAVVHVSSKRVALYRRADQLEAEALGTNKATAPD